MPPLPSRCRAGCDERVLAERARAIPRCSRVEPYPPPRCLRAKPPRLCVVRPARAVPRAQAEPGSPWCYWACSRHRALPPACRSQEGRERGCSCLRRRTFVLLSARVGCGLCRVPSGLPRRLSAHPRRMFCRGVSALAVSASCHSHVLELELVSDLPAMFAGFLADQDDSLSLGSFARIEPSESVVWIL